MDCIQQQKMSTNHTKLLLVSANVGSIFEDPEHMLQMWLKEFLADVKRLSPDFLAIHCQEVGGKNYEDSMKHVNLFVKALLASDTLQHYDKSRVFLDEDFTAVDKFTALGSLYFIHQSVQNAQIYDFQVKQFVPLSGQEVLSGNIEHVTIKEKAKFPQEFFPNYKWSRKGFIRTRWNVSNTTFDLVNIHLFHDASNIVAMEASPSEYCLTRKNALLYTIKRFETDEYPKVPYFMFGDFNFRLDTYKIIQDLTAKLKEHRCKGKKDELSKITYTDDNQDTVMLTVEKKGFEHHQHEDIFFNCSHWLKAFDQETACFSDKLLEYPVTFPPSYPFSEDVNDGTSYMKTRCPSWCDRILYTPSAKSLIIQDAPPDYNMMGRNVCMGDHKPIYLNVKLRSNSGNHDNTATTPPCGDSHKTNSPVPRPKRRPLRKVISINGEECEADKLDDINIHDYTQFEHEQLIAGSFMSSIRRKSYAGGESNGEYRGFLGGSHKPSFKDVVKGVMKAEQVINILYSHRSDTEEDSDQEEIRGRRGNHYQSPDDIVDSESIEIVTKELAENNNIAPDIVRSDPSDSQASQTKDPHSVRDNNNTCDLSVVTSNTVPTSVNPPHSVDPVAANHNTATHAPSGESPSSRMPPRDSNGSVASVHGPPTPTPPQAVETAPPAESEKLLQDRKSTPSPVAAAARRHCPCCVLL